MAGACKTAKTLEQNDLRAELEQAVWDDQNDAREDKVGGEYVRAFMEKRGEAASSLFERLVTEATSGNDGNPYLVEAALDGLVALRSERARGLIEALAHSEKAKPYGSERALRALVALAPEAEKVGLLASRLMKVRDPEEQKWVVDEMVTQGRPEGVPYLKELRAKALDVSVQWAVDAAIVMLSDPAVCSVYGETQGVGPVWSCLYRCAGPVRTRGRILESGCPKTIPNKAAADRP